MAAGAADERRPGPPGAAPADTCWRIWDTTD